MERIFITNRKKQKICVTIEKSRPQKGLAFVMHGLGGFKEQPHVQTFAQAFRNSGYTVVCFDTTNALGESDGKFEDATITTSYEDLEDIIAWSKDCEWYQEPFALAGHSLGGFCTAYFAENNPDKVSGLAPISSVVSGKLSFEAHQQSDPEGLKEWKKTGWRVSASNDKPGVIKRRPWSHMEDRLKYDLLPLSSKLTMPVILIVGEKDDGTPPEHQQILYEQLPGKKEIHVIKDAPHTFRDKGELAEIQALLQNWISRLL
jgi:pimeloyl-ACP methyl ester carboxylesterase